MKLTKRALPVVVSSLLVAGITAGCSNNESASTKSKKGGESDSNKPLDITIMMPSFDQELADENSTVVKKLEEETNTDIHLRWTPNDTYPDKFSITLASGDLPDIMVSASSYVKAAQSGEFWDVGKYIDDYPNLKKLNPIIRQNASINGTLYGIPRIRALGRNGIMIRKDWLDKLGLQEPKTTDDLYKILVAFKNDDPDGNGKDDTYGMTVSQFSGPWDNIQTWFGVPNEWGVEKGKLKPYFEFPEYQEALDYFKKLFDEGLINKDFAAMPPSKWYDDIQNNKAGVIVDVVDSAHRIEKELDKLEFGENSTAEQQEQKTFMTALGGVADPDGKKHYLPTSGFSNLLLIPKPAVKTEAELKRVLKFIDQTNNQENQRLLFHGIKGKQYTLDGNGYVVATTDKSVLKDLQDLNQFQTFIPEDLTIKPQQTPLREKEAEIQKENEKYVVGNPAAGLISETYSRMGAQLDQIIDDARIKYISGQIDKAGLKAAIDQWRSQGGDQVTKEMNQLYSKTKK
ncbi:extracellular solute-binding protein [Neobacillus sp. Marseille-QA0830]